METELESPSEQELEEEEVTPEPKKEDIDPSPSRNRWRSTSMKTGLERVKSNQSQGHDFRQRHEVPHGECSFLY